MKCNSCNIVISEILAFIQNQVDVMTEDSIVRLCVTSFSLEEVVEAKNLLFQSVKTSEKKILRKGKAVGRVQRDVEDIISLIKCTEAEMMPVFVAKELRKLPPVTFDHIDVTRLLKDIIIIKDKIQVMQEEYATIEQLNRLKTDLNTLKQTSIINNYEHPQYVNTKRGTRNPLTYRRIETDSGPFGLLNLSEDERQNQVDTVTVQIQSADLNCGSTNCEPVLSPSQSHAEYLDNMPSLSLTNKMNPAIALSQSDTKRSDALSLSPAGNDETGQASNKRVEAITAVSTIDKEIETPDRAQRASQTIEDGSKVRTARSHNAPSGNILYSQRAKEGGDFINRPDEKWIKVQRKKLRNQFVGIKGLAKDPKSRFKAADIKVPLFINNVDMQVSIDDITDYIKTKTQEDVNLIEIKMKKQRGYKAYKVFVPKNKLTTFLDENLWPEGISFRRFVDFEANRLRSVKGREAFNH